MRKILFRNRTIEMSDGTDVPIKKMMIGGLCALVVLFFLWSCPYCVDNDAEAVVTTLGKYEITTGPGMHFKAPWLIQKKEVIRTKEIKRLEFGFRTAGVGKYTDHPEESIMLTGDENIVSLDFILQYLIADPVCYVFNVRDPEASLRDAMEACMRLVVGDSPIDAALTTGKADIQDRAKTYLQEICDTYNFGLRIIAVQLQDVIPPPEVAEAFKDVASAKENKSQIISKAQEYYNENVPKARGNAEALIKDAEGYKTERTEKARGDVSRFQQMYNEWQQNKSITEDRLYFETMEMILPHSTITIESEQNPSLKHFAVKGGN